MDARKAAPAIIILTRMSEHRVRNIFQSGAIEPAFIAQSIAKHHSNTAIGGHSIFLGQVRADEINGKTVTAIDYTADEALASSLFHEIRQEIFAKYPITCMHVHHTLGIAKAGEICLFVFTSSAHRAAAISACNEVVERLKAELPVWGKEIFDDETYQWKENRPL